MPQRKKITLESYTSLTTIILDSESVNFEVSCKIKDGNSQTHIRIPEEATKQCKGRKDTEFKVSFYHM